MPDVVFVIDFFLHRMEVNHNIAETLGGSRVGESLAGSANIRKNQMPFLNAFA